MQHQHYIMLVPEVDVTLVRLAPNSFELNIHTPNQYNAMKQSRRENETCRQKRV